MKICENCDKEFEPTKNNARIRFCSRDCSNHWHRTHGKEKYTYICQYCGKEYHPKAKDRNKYCSRECAFAAKAVEPIERKRPICAVCGKEFDGRLNAKYCSNECKKENARIKERVRSKQRHDYIVNPIKCKECGKTFTPSYGNKHREFCSDECCRKYNKRQGKRNRRALKRGAFVSSVDYNTIYNRDNGICRLCGKKVDHNLLSPNPNSGTIDHIIPLACGGTHEPKNVQLAHMICNSLKGTKPMNEQLRLA